MEAAAIGLGIVFIVIMFLSARNKLKKIREAVAQAQTEISQESEMTASVGLFHPDATSTVVIGASEEKGIFYYRLLQSGKTVVATKMNLANLSRVELIVDHGVKDFDCFTSDQPTTSLKAKEVCGNVLSHYAPTAIKALRRAALRISFVSESGEVKTLEITSLRETNNEGDEGIQAFRNAIWWVAFLNIASRNSRHKR